MKFDFSTNGDVFAEAIFTTLYLVSMALVIGGLVGLGLGLTLYLTRTSSLAALIATPLTLPLLAWQEPAALLPMSVLTLLIVWRHRGNLRDLFAGRERHF